MSNAYDEKLLSEKPLNEEQRRLLGKVLYRALLEMRILGWEGKANQSADLADAFHNLPLQIYSPNFSWDILRTFLESYQTRYPRTSDSGFDYLFFLEKIESGATDIE